jgi:UDP-N-acetylglucosamine transferase subunit ALG13
VIFVTVGSQMPFRRLVRAVDEWALLNPGIEVLAQVGSGETYRPAALRAFPSVPPDRYAELVRDCELVVAHAGMGSVLTALEHGKPMVLMPRRGALQETRNDHQLATLHWLRAKPGIYPAEDETALKAALDAWRIRGLAPPSPDGDRSSSLESLVETLRRFIG